MICDHLYICQYCSKVICKACTYLDINGNILCYECEGDLHDLECIDNDDANTDNI